MTRNLPKPTPPVLNEATIRPDQKNDHASGGAANRRAQRSTRGAASCADERTNARPERDPSEYIALKF